MVDRWTLTFEVEIRSCQRQDLKLLEWFGMFSDQREVFHLAFERYEKGEIAMLVSVCNSFPIGQVWIDLWKKRSEGVGIVWALRVLPCFQNLGVGSRLLGSAEEIIRDKGLPIAEVGVAKENFNAKRLYERLNYQVVGDNVEQWSYETPDGVPVHVQELEWILQKRL